MFLGLDLGTSGLRMILLDASQKVIADCNVEYLVSHPHIGWSEQEPTDWTNACDQAIGILKKQAPNAIENLSAIGISGHMHGATLINKSGEALRPCILWNDTRSYKEAQKLDEKPAFHAISGNIVFPGFTAPKLAWVKANEPIIFNQIWKVLLPKDYLRFWLTGDAISDMSDSAGTAWMDVGKRQWSDKLLELSGMNNSQMPDLIEGSEVGGMLLERLRKKWGIKNPVLIVGGGGDNAAAACGAGVFREGEGFVSLGTSGVLLVARNGYSPAPETAVHSFCHAIPDTWYQMGVILSAADCLTWLSRLTGQSVMQISGLLPDKINGPSRAGFLPYLSGERTPHNDSDLRGGFTNLDITDGVKELTQAVMEGVSFALRDNLEALKLTGANLTHLIAMGGGAQSRFWIETIATIFNLPIQIPKKGEFGAAFGAARLAMIGANIGSISDILTAPKISVTIEPKDNLINTYNEKYERFKNAYPIIKEL